MEIIKQELNQLETGIYLVTSTNCPTCEKLKDMIKGIDLASKVILIDAVKHQAICMEYSIVATPCLLDIKAGKEYDRMYGARSESAVLDFLKGE